MSVWTRFNDMHSGGYCKERFEHLYVEAEEDEASSVFFARFGHSPSRVTCTCCGEDYSLEEYNSLEEATLFDRQQARREQVYKATGKFVAWDEMDALEPESLADYFAREDVAVLFAESITYAERQTVVPSQGYVWQN